jgi:hypothetical protein
MVCKLTGYTVFAELPNKEAATVAKSLKFILAVLGGSGRVKTIYIDNGSEFRNHDFQALLKQFPQAVHRTPPEFAPC